MSTSAEEDLRLTLRPHPNWRDAKYQAIKWFESNGVVRAVREEEAHIIAREYGQHGLRQLIKIWRGDTGLALPDTHIPKGRLRRQAEGPGIPSGIYQGWMPTP